MRVGNSLADNLREAEQQCTQAARSGAELVVLPEYFGDMFGVGTDPRSGPPSGRIRRRESENNMDFLQTIYSHIE